jgi:hypothetical protein
MAAMIHSRKLWKLTMDSITGVAGVGRFICHGSGWPAAADAVDGEHRQRRNKPGEQSHCPGLSRLSGARQRRCAVLGREEPARSALVALTCPFIRLPAARGRVR